MAWFLHTNLCEFVRGYTEEEICAVIATRFEEGSVVSELVVGKPVSNGDGLSHLESLGREGRREGRRERGRRGEGERSKRQRERRD